MHRFIVTTIELRYEKRQYSLNKKKHEHKKKKACLVLQAKEIKNTHQDEALKPFVFGKFVKFFLSSFMIGAIRRVDFKLMFLQDSQQAFISIEVKYR